MRLWLEDRVWFLILTGLLIAAAGVLAGYALGYSRGYARGRVQWKSVFEELRDFDEAETLSE